MSGLFRRRDVAGNLVEMLRQMHVLDASAIPWDAVVILGMRDGSIRMSAWRTEDVEWEMPLIDTAGQMIEKAGAGFAPAAAAPKAN